MDTQNQSTDVAVVIPARLGGQRLPNKVLLPLAGKPLLWHVWNLACSARLANSLFIATDSEEIRHEAITWGADVLLTDSDCQSGTERIASVLDQIDAELIVNVRRSPGPSAGTCTLMIAWRTLPSS